MLTKEEIKIIKIFESGLCRDYTIRGLMKKISKNSYTWTYKAVKKLAKLEIINTKEEGKSKMCSINLNNNLTLIYLSLLEESRIHTKKLPQRNIYELLRSIPLSYFTFIVAGSYASGNATKKSDLDIVVLVENGTDTKKLLAILKNKGELMIPEAHPYVFTKSEFLQMLLSEEENYGKFIVKNKLIIFGAENYYLIIKEAIKNGFRD